MLSIVEAAYAALLEIFTPPFRGVLIKTLVVTLALLAAVFVGLEKLVVTFLVAPYPWLTTLINVLAGAGLVIGFAFAITPASFLIAGLYFDDLAEIVETKIDPAHVGTRPALADLMQVSLKFVGAAILVNVLAFVLLLVPLVNAVVFFLANAYLLGRGYFDFAAARYRSVEDVAALRRAHGLDLWLAGFLIAALAAIPIANLLTPLFGAALMVRLHKSFSTKPVSSASGQP